MVSQYTIGVLKDVMFAANVTSLMITSTARAPREQARVMFNNLERYGVEHQKRLYGKYGDLVIDAYSALKRSGKHDAAIMDAMFRKIIALDPSKISNHVADTSKLNVIDIAPSSIPSSQRRSFLESALADARISRVLGPPRDPAYHFEIPQPSAK